MGMNNLLGAGTEFVCSDGRMSVNGICKTPEQAIQSVQPITASPVQDSDGNGSDYEFDKTVKSTFEWDFDKPNNKVENFGTTIKDNITAYDKYVADKLGISSKTVGINRAVTSAGTLFSGGGIKAAAGPFGLAFAVGGLMKRKEKEKPEVIDTMSFKDTPTVTYQDYGQGGVTDGNYDTSNMDAQGNYDDPLSDDTE